MIKAGCKIFVRCFQGWWKRSKMSQRVVIVDDELIPRKIAEKALKDHYQVSTYDNAKTALEDLP
ncbi:hypothetical protein HMPREF6123_0976, partial [Oribacterium sinus F0268]